jgi:hypothetical protein
MAAKERTALPELDVAGLQRELLKCGVFLGDRFAGAAR